MEYFTPKINKPSYWLQLQNVDALCRYLIIYVTK
jgi:hypothetical protein